MVEPERVAEQMRDVLTALSELTLDDVLTASVALQAGWMTDAAREELKPLADALERLSQVPAL